MTELVVEKPKIAWRISVIGWAGIGGVVLLLGLAFRADIIAMVSWWYNREEYSHGFLIPLVSAYLLWDKRFDLARSRFTGAWFGVGLVAAGMLLGVVGSVATIQAVAQYSFVFVLIGLALAILGARAFRIVWVAMLILLFMVPLPNFIYHNLSSYLQLVSSEIGVFVIRLFGISVFLEGNVIDLGIYKLQVVEACDGLRYLFPLMTLGLIMAYLFRAPMWKRAVLFLSTIPITVLMNSFRIGVIGVTVDRWGTKMAEGFLHSFEGWTIFMGCFAILLGEIWLLARIGGEKRPFSSFFGLDPVEPLAAGTRIEPRRFPIQAKLAAAIVIAGAAAMLAIPNRTEVIPQRTAFSEFPLRIGQWQGRPDRLEQHYIDALKFTDYVLVNYISGSDIVNLYSAYYESQRKGESVHSPRSCIPGGGWRIESITKETLPAPGGQGKPMHYNRVLITMGDEHQLVYYWFEQRGRRLTNEYLVKWYIFWDALTRNRTDGSLVRLTTPVRTAEDVASADARLRAFLPLAEEALGPYIPE